VLNWAKTKGWLDRSPLAGIGGGSFENHDNDYVVTLAVYRDLLKACRTQEWRTILALSRIGGLRCPSELMQLRWCDIDFDRGYFVVRSPKTEHRRTGVSRDVPIFPELR
jgi:integrase